MPENWGEITIKQFSNYNVALKKYNDKLNAYLSTDKVEMSEIQKIILESNLYLGIMAAMTGKTEDDLSLENLHVVKDYVETLGFIHKARKDKVLKGFTFKGVDYTLPEYIKPNTKFGQYINALQAEMASRHNDPSSMEFIAHQLAHMVEYGVVKKNEWNEAERDKLAVEFLNLPSTIAMDFAFFLNRQSEIYRIVALDKAAQALGKNNKYMKELLEVTDGLSLYTKSPKRVSLLDKVRVRLNLLRIRIHQMCSTS